MKKRAEEKKKQMHTKCPECDLTFSPEFHEDKIEKLEAENARYREALSKIESLTFSWVMTKENAEDILLIVAPIRDAVRKTREEIKL